MAGGPEDQFTDSRELYVLVEGDDWAHTGRCLGASPSRVKAEIARFSADLSGRLEQRPRWFGL
jgi:hypothetical protein